MENDKPTESGYFWYKDDCSWSVVQVVDCYGSLIVPLSYGKHSWQTSVSELPGKWGPKIPPPPKE